jgi:hypothetical protein
MRAKRAACRTCGLVETHITHGRCRACYQYRRRTGRERPAYLRDPRLPFVCGACGGPAGPWRRRWCAACYMRHLRARREERAG